MARLTKAQKKRAAAAVKGWETRRAREKAERLSRARRAAQRSRKPAKAPPKPRKPAKAPPKPRKPAKAPPKPRKPAKAPPKPRKPKSRPLPARKGPAKAPPPKRAPKPKPGPKGPSRPAQRHRHLPIPPDVLDAFPHVERNGVWRGQIEPIYVQRREAIEQRLLELEEYIRPIVVDLEDAYVRIGFKVQIRTDHKYDKHKGPGEIWGHYHKAEAVAYAFVNAGLEGLAGNILEWGDKIIAILCELVIARKRPEEPFQ